MKRPSSSDALAGSGVGGLIPSICTSPTEDKVVFGRAGSFQSILEGFGEEEEEEMMMETGSVVSLSSGEKKRRLSVEQVKALEKNFEVENKLEPERKVKLAQELGLQPRQVAVWFQNRRARWKTKQLERDYGVLKANYDTLKLNYDVLNHDKQALLAEIKELKTKLAGEGESNHCSVKEEPVEKEEEELEMEDKNNEIGVAHGHVHDVVEEEEEEEEEIPLIYKDGSSDSDSSANLNDDNSPYHLGNRTISHQNQVQEEEQKQEQQQLMFMGFNCTSSYSPLQCPDGRGSRFGLHYYQHQQMAMKLEDNGFLTGEEPCSSSFFSDEQPPSLSWYCSDQWD